jgi:hypothetical protein
LPLTGISCNLLRFKRSVYMHTRRTRDPEQQGTAAAAAAAGAAAGALQTGADAAAADDYICEGVSTSEGLALTLSARCRIIPRRSKLVMSLPAIALHRF